MSLVKIFYRQFDNFSVSLKNWEIPDRGITLLWGPSGSGKSTIIRGLLGLDEKASIKWFFKNQEIGQKPPSQRHLGVVFQDLGLFPHMNAKNNILFPVDKKKHPHWKEDFDCLVESLELKTCLSRSTQNLSGGEKQRVALARTLIYRPQMLLLDEPFSSLDEKIKKKTQNLLKEFCKNNSVPVLLVTHDLSDVKSFVTGSDSPPCEENKKNRKNTCEEFGLINKVSQIKEGRIFREGSAPHFLQQSSSVHHETGTGFKNSPKEQETS